jgi:hypothetical protein
MAVGGEADHSTPMSVVKPKCPLELTHLLNMARMWYPHFFVLLTKWMVLGSRSRNGRITVKRVN